jgi:hypothetical protein
MPRRRRRIRAGFALFAILFVCGAFVLHDVASGAVLFVAVLVLIWTGMYALRDEDPDAVRDNARRGLGWIWF